MYPLPFLTFNFYFLSRSLTDLRDLRGEEIFREAQFRPYPIRFSGTAELFDGFVLQLRSRFSDEETIAISLLVAGGFFSAPVSTFAAVTCDQLRARECEGEDCLAKYKAIQDCETARIAESRRVSAAACSSVSEKPRPNAKRISRTKTD